MSWSVEKSVVAGFGLALGILAALAAISYQDTIALMEATQGVAHTHESLDELEQILAAVTDAETGTRGFVLTGDEQHLAPYHAAVTGLERRLTRVEELTADHPGQQELVDLLRQRIAERFDLLKETITARNKLGSEGTWKTMLTGKGKQRMDAFRRIVFAMQAVESDLLRRRTAEQAARAQRAVMTMAVGGGLAFVLVTLAGILLRRDMTRRRRAEEALGRAGVKLTGWAEALEQRGREITFLGEMGDLLQSCRTAQEAYDVILQFAPQLFPGAAGVLGVLAPSKNVVEVVATWGAPLTVDRTFAPNTCWALRRGRLHSVENPREGPLCGHVSPTLSTGYLCAAMMAQGEPLGVLQLQEVDEEPAGSGPVPKHAKESKRQLALSVAQHIALAVANLRLQETLRRQAIRDPLTDLFNRRYMEESLDREIRRATRKRTPLGIIMLDIDHFKRFNDTFGHEAGDVLLRAVAGFLKAHVRGEDIACRYGGEEFTLILPGAPLDVSTQRAERLRAGISDLIVPHEGQSLGPVTISLGVAIFPEHGPTGDAVLRAADAALYRAKQEGRNRVVAVA